MKKFLSVAKNMIPAVIVIVVLVICAAMPELGVIPERLTGEVNAQETSSDESDEETEAAAGDYEDGIYTGSAAGYGGTITVQVTVEDGQITEIEVLEHSGETESFYNRAVAVIDSIILYQTWEVDAVSGATYSSDGIKNAVKNALTGEITESETASSSEGDEEALTEVEYEDPDGYVDGTYTGSAAGFGGTITVSVTIEGGIITSIEIVSAPGETTSYLSSAAAVIDAILAAQSPNVDAVSGATYSSNGIINAVKSALNKAAAGSSEDDSSSDETESSSESTQTTSASAAELTSLTNYGYIDGTYTGTAAGYGGDVTLSITIEGGYIVSIEVVSAEGETYAYWNQAIALIDEIIAAQTTDGIDAVSGATYSSNGIINAVKEALAQAAASDDEEDEEEDGEDDDEDEESGSDSSDDSSGDSSSDDSDSETNYLPNYGYADGTYVGTAAGYGGDVTLSITIEGGYIVSIEVVSAEGETYAYWNQAIVLIDEIIAAQTTDGIDAVSGATYSSNGIINAVKEALAQAAASEEEDDDDDDDSGKNEESGGDSSDDSSGDSSSDDSDSETSYLSNYGYADGTYVGTAAGYGGDVTLSITIEGGYIVSIEVVSAEGETYAYWNQAIVLIDEIIAAQTTDGIDAVSGATYSSNGIINAVKEALAQAAASDEEDDEEEDGEDDDEDEESGSDSSEGSSDDSSGDDSDDDSIDFSALPNYGYIDGTYEGTGEGWGGDVVISVTIEGGQIVSLEVVSAEGETYAYWNQAVALLETILLAQTADGVDAVSGATFSSEGILEAVADALAQAADSGEDAGGEDADGEDSGDTEEETTSPDDSEDSSEPENGGDSEEDEEDEENEENEDDDASSEPITSVETETYTVSGTAAVHPDEDEDFEEYEITVTITLQTTTTTVEDAGAVTVTTETEITDAQYEADTDSTNLRYLSKAWTNMIDGLIAGEEVDAVSGATCSSTGIQEAWDAALAGTELGTETETGEAENTEPVTETTSETESYSYVFTVYPDEDEDFDAYEVTITVYVQTTSVTVTDGDTAAVTTTVEIISAEYESDTTKSNLRYFEKAWALIDSLIAEEEVDAVSGATCSSNALIEIWEQIEADINPGTYETVNGELSESASYTMKEDEKLYTSAEVSVKKEEDER